MSKLPNTIQVNRIPYKIRLSDNKYSYEADPGKQEICVAGSAAEPRKRQYLLWEIAHLLLQSAGMMKKDCDRYHTNVGSCLYRFVVDNDLDFVKGKKKIPSMLWVNGIPYQIRQGMFKELEDDDLGGQVTYDTLSIQIMENLKEDIKLYVVVHEITHALLFEASAGSYAGREPFVEALAWQLLYFLQDNDLSILKPKGE